jgi:uncharacterized protein
VTFQGAADPRFERGLEEFRAGRFFEAHEEWELLWNDSADDDRLFVQALIQLAAGCVHLTRGNRAPAGRLFALARAKLERVPGGFSPFPLDGLREALAAPIPEAAPDPRSLFRL